MLRKLSLILTVTAILALPSSAMAKDVVQFQDGRYLEIERYTVNGDVIRLVLGGKSIVAFPVDRIEKIARGGLVVFRPANAEQTAGEDTAAGEVTATKPARRLPHRS